MKNTNKKTNLSLTGLNAIAIEVSDFELSLYFYRKIMGLRVDVMAPGHYAQIPEVNISLLHTGSDFVSQGFHIEFLLEDVDKWHSHLLSHAVKLPSKPENQPWGSRSFYFQDPNGHTLEITSAIPA